MKTIGFAFFDVDGTLLSFKSMFSFHDFWTFKWRSSQNPDHLSENLEIAAILSRSLANPGLSREELNRRYYEFFSGRSVKEIEECARIWFKHVELKSDLFLHEPLKELMRLRQVGYEPVLVSGSFIELIDNIAKKLGIKHILATRLATDNGKYTGKIIKHQMIGTGKSDAIKEFAEEKEISLKSCYAFGDDISDLPMLETVSKPVVVEGDSSLEAIAVDRGWPIILVKRAIHLSQAVV